MSEINEVRNLPTPEIKMPPKNESAPCGEAPEVNIFDGNGNGINNNPPLCMDKESQALLEGFYDAIEEYYDEPEPTMCPPMSSVAPKSEPIASSAPDAAPQPSAPSAPQPAAPEECPPMSDIASAPDVAPQPAAPSQPSAPSAPQPSAPEECPPMSDIASAPDVDAQPAAPSQPSAPSAPQPSAPEECPSAPSVNHSDAEVQNSPSDISDELSSIQKDFLDLHEQIQNDIEDGEISFS